MCLFYCLFFKRLEVRINVQFIKRNNDFFFDIWEDNIEKVGFEFRFEVQLKLRWIRRSLNILDGVKSIRLVNFERLLCNR